MKNNNLDKVVGRSLAAEEEEDIVQEFGEFDFYSVVKLIGLFNGNLQASTDAAPKRKS